MKTRKLTILISALTGVLILSACNNATTSHALFICYNNGSTGVFVSLGTDSGASSSWTYAESGSISNYISFTPGTYSFLVDTNEDHSEYTTCSDSEYTYESGFTYEITYDGSEPTIVKVE